jgi:hypothetical protein
LASKAKKTACRERWLNARVTDQGDNLIISIDGNEPAPFRGTGATQMPLRRAAAAVSKRWFGCGAEEVG